MPLEACPSEILLLIASCFTSIKDLFSLIRTNRKLYNVLIAALYKKNIKSDGGSAIVWYVKHGNEVGVRKMLAAGANVQSQPTALLDAVEHKNICIVQILLEHGALPDASDLRSKRPLTLATRGRSDVAITKLLLDYGASVNSVPLDKNSPLLEAVRSNQESKVMLLLQYGADPHIMDSRNSTNLLHVAATSNAAPKILKLLIDAGVDVNSQDNQGRTPLQLAASHSSTRAVRILLSYGANVDSINTNYHWDGWTALFFAAKKPRNTKADNKTIIRTLVLHGANVEFKNALQQTPLLYAISQGAVKPAKALLECGANIMARNSNDESVLHLAFASGRLSPDMTGWLVDSGAKINYVGGTRKETPIFYAIRSRHRDGVQSLLDLGADVNLRNVDGMTPLSIAVCMGCIRLTKMLLDHGALVNAKDLQGRDPLHHASRIKYWSILMVPPKVPEIVALLIQHGADVNSRDHLGYTPLHEVVTNEGAWDAALELLKAGADRLAMANDGRVPHDMISDGPWAETKRLFIRSYQSGKNSS